MGILFSYWIAYGTSHIGGTRCAPEVPYSGPLLNGKAMFDPYNDVPAGGCTGQTEASWRIPVGLQMLPALCLGIGMMWMPFSPRWLMEQGRDTEALATISRLRRKPEADPAVRFEFLEIKAEVMFTNETQAIEDASNTGSGYWTRLVGNYLALVKTWPKFKRLAVGCLVMFYQQFMGCNAIIYYAPTSKRYMQQGQGPPLTALLVFGQLGLDPTTTSLLATGVYGIVNTVSTLPAVILLDKVGRRPLLMAGALGCFASLVIVGTLIAAFGSNWPAHPVAGHVAIAFVYIYDVNFSYSWAPIGWVLPSEIFPLALRSTGISITTSCTWMSNFIIGLVSPIMLTTLAHGGTYFFFAGFSVLAFFTTVFFIPETKGRTLEEMDVAFGDSSTDKEKQRMADICRELGLPEQVFTS
ncbi:hypothetical protein HWV62_31799 [Athelia sp. TMB]|nr:hypothetical protein HWV62_31799 [Athelia sp. TMB]